MRSTRSTGFIAVTLTIALLGFEAIALLGLARVASSWTPARVAAVARAGATTWSALTRAAQHTLVIQTLPAALTAVRTTQNLMRAAHRLWPATNIDGTGSPAHGETRLAIVRAPVGESSVAHACGHAQVATRVVCVKTTRTHALKSRPRNSS